MGAVALSVIGFAARGLASLAGATWVRSRPAKIVPHVVDTLLLLSAISLVWMLGLNPLGTPWLLAKIGALGLYIVLGSLALKRAATRTGQAAAGLAALATVGWIIATAVGKQPWLP